MYRLVLIEDDPDLYTLLVYVLRNEGFHIYGARAGRDTVELCRRERPHLILLDIMLPDADGLEICSRIRQDAVLRRTPIIFLTARGSERDRIAGLELGANDYLVKPFFIKELIARIRLQLRGRDEQASLVQAGGLQLDRRRRAVVRNQDVVPLSPAEFRMLETLMMNTGVALSRHQLLRAAWGVRSTFAPRIVDVYMRRIRAKLQDDPARPRLVHAVRGHGYKFEDRP